LRLLFFSIFYEKIRHTILKQTDMWMYFWKHFFFFRYIL